MDDLTLTPIGVVRNSVTDAVDAEWGQVVTEIHVQPELAAGLRGLEDWSHMIVVFYMHNAEFDMATHLVRRPRDLPEMPELGIFAQRARHRPNKIGLTAVKIMGVEGNVVRVRGLDAMDGTPILDLKPYAPVYDGATDPLIPGWFVRLMQGYF